LDWKKKAISSAGYGEAVIKVRLTTIRGTDIHVVKGEYRLYPGRKERMKRSMRLVEARRIDLTPLITHAFTLDEISRTYGLS
jgi:threonine dehydrogenase-like Zn-dependent dehydrogenase